MRNVAMIGAGMTRFAKYPDRGLKDLSHEAVSAALEAAGIDKKAPQIAVVGNAAAGLTTGQECIRAQVILRSMGIDRIPMVNTENACASSSTALQVAWLYVASGMYDVALALGVEKMYTADKSRAMSTFSAGVDVEELRQIMEQLKPPSEQKAGGGKRSRQEPQPVHGHLRGGRAGPHGKVRHDERAVRTDRRQEPQQRQPQPACPVSRAIYGPRDP